MSKHDETPVMENGNVALPEELRELPKETRIISAKLKDDHCLYDYIPLEGPQKGIAQGTKKNNLHIIKNSMKEAFAAFNVHMAFLDNLFKVAGIDMTNIDDFHSHEFALNMECSEFKIIGDDGHESIVLIGTKHVDLGWQKIETVKVPLDSGSSYKWYNELKTAADTARHEVEEYRKGNYTILEDDDDEEEESLKQTTINWDHPGGVAPEASTSENEEEFDDEFGEARL